MSVPDVMEHLKTSPQGLASEEVKQRQQKFGANKLETKKQVSKLAMFLSQLKDVLVLVLIAAGLMSFFIGSYSDGIIMFIIVFVNATIGFYQEFKAEKILDSLKSLVQSPAKVIRNGELQETLQVDLVPGDFVIIEEGDKVPADIRIVESFNLKSNDFALTGESMPQEKHSNKVEDYATIGDRDNMLYLGTSVAIGNAKGIVVSTGMNTELGKIADLTQTSDSSLSPLQMELGTLGNTLTAIAVFISIVLFGVAVWQGFSLRAALIYALGIAASSVPQALPAQVSVALSQGSGRLAAKNAIVKKLSAVETLGSTTVICTDKTGTLTKNEMTVQALYFNDKEYGVTGLGYEPTGNIVNENKVPITTQELSEMEIMLDAATMASNAEIHHPDENHANWYPIGDPTEAALITLSTKVGTRSPKEDEENPELHEFPFDSFRKRMSSVRKFGDKQVLCMKGATDSVLAITKHIYKNGKSVPITEQDKKNILDINTKYSKQAMRVISIAYRELDPSGKDYVEDEIEKDVIFLGMVAMIDPPKEGVKEAIENAHQAHIRTFIMTGDHAITAQAVGREVNLSSTGEDVDVVTGAELNKMSDKMLKEKMEGQEAVIFSRVSPEDKLRIVKNLKQENEIVAVTGDGVNDAPALKNAHIGVAMGTIGTDVAKEASELVLLDDSFTTLVDAVREGRTIFNNLRKTILASMTTNAAELAVVMLGFASVALFKMPIPILAIQILAIDLLAEVLPLTALTFDPGSQTLMNAPPRNRDEHILNKKSGIEVIFFGVLIGALAFINFAWFGNRMGVTLTDTHPLYMRATTICYVTIALCQYANIMSRRYEFTSVFNKSFFTNTKLLISIGISFGMVLLAIYVPFISRFLKFAPLQMMDWLYVVAAAFVVLLSHEVLKIIRRSKRG
ncbi:cation-translocating P-type ATPase [Clostridium sp. 'deep sea']|nr:cation-translocating P-type ATPase [Clostridium sp. 'deep sea']